MRNRQPATISPRDLGPVLRTWTPFLALVAVAAVLKLMLAGAGGAALTWKVILGLWGLGAAWAGLRIGAASGSTAGALIAALVLQNVTIQLFVVLPSLLAGVGRLSVRGTSDSVFWGNAVATVIVVPLLSAVILSFLGLLVAVPLARLRGRAR